VVVVVVVVNGATACYWALEFYYSGFKKYDVQWGVPVSHSPKTLSTGVNNKDIQIPSKHNRFIILYHFRATCFDSLESSSGPLMK